MDYTSSNSSVTGMTRARRRLERSPLTVGSGNCRGTDELERFDPRGLLLAHQLNATHAARHDPSAPHTSRRLESSSLTDRPGNRGASTDEAARLLTPPVAAHPDGRNEHGGTGPSAILAVATAAEDRMARRLRHGSVPMRRVRLAFSVTEPLVGRKRPPPESRRRSSWWHAGR